MKKLLIVMLAGLFVLAGCQNNEDQTFKEKLCVLVSHIDDSCDEAYHFDADVPLVFYKNEKKALNFAVLNEDGNKALKTAGFPKAFQSIESGKSFVWDESNVEEPNVSVVFGLADDSVHGIVVDSEGGIQANRIRIKENLSLWYVVKKGEEMNRPIKVKAFDQNGDVIEES
ncbi:hypothetical protein LC040_02435 [Bacillus tianshenii]|nr:hypothetical protein LC040_02435 [Bacillus tianshenii]